jgi:hypothetical protein
LTNNITDPNQPIDYLMGTVPTTYKCNDCGATNCKLWREYNIFLSHQTLRCAVCAGKDQKKSVKTIDINGKMLSKWTGSRTDQIGSLIPAVPTEENDTYWGYSSVPTNGCDWWKHLPSLPINKDAP